jgi:hypothetical protein
VPDALEAGAELPAMPADDEAMPALRMRARTDTPLGALRVRWAVRERQTEKKAREAPKTRRAARAATGTGGRACSNLRALERCHANAGPCLAALRPPGHSQWRLPAQCPGFE